MKDLINKWASDPQLSFMLNIVFGFITAISFAFAVLVFFAQSRKEKAYEEILKAAERENEFNKTEEDIQKNKQYVESLKAQVAKDIPKYARIAVLKAKVERLHNELSDDFKEYMELKKELVELGEEIDNDELDQRLIEVINPYAFKINQKTMLILFGVFIFISPLIGEIVAYLDFIISTRTSSPISLNLALLYICSLISATICLSPIIIRRTRLSTKRRLILLSVIFIISSFVVFYFPLFDIVQGWIYQLPLTLLSILLFAIGMSCLVSALIKMSKV